MYSISEKSNNSEYVVVDLRSDTVTKPTAAMRRAMAEAEVGDDVYGEDPTVVKLEKKVAALFEKEAAIFVPTGTMGNLLAVMVHCNRRGSEAICGSSAHSHMWEQGNAAQLAGVSLTQIDNKPDGTFCLNELKNKIRGADIHEPVTSLVLIENTHNYCGGKTLPLEWIEELSKLAKENNLKIHMDGARVFNAAEFLNVPVSRIVRDVDSVSFCLSKGLSCPAGCMLVGSKSFISQAHRLRKALGGGMRQIGVLAAPGLVALEEVVPALKYDHLRAKKLAQAVIDLKSPNFTLDIDGTQTNIIMLEIKNPKISANELTNRLTTVTAEELRNGIVDKNGKSVIIKSGAKNDRVIRMVTHIQIDDELIDLAVKKLTFVLKDFDFN